MLPATQSGLIFVLCLALVPGCAASTEPLAKITVEAGQHIRIDTPVSVSLSGVPGCSSDAALRLEEIKGSRRLPVPSQLEPGSPPRLWWILSGTTPAGGERIYELVQGRPVETPAVKLTKNDLFLQIKVAGDKVLRYNHALIKPPEGADKIYARSGFIHPLWSPAGTILTASHDPASYHHMGIWMPWTKTKFQGREVDFWNLHEGEGTVPVGRGYRR